MKINPTYESSTDHFFYDLFYGGYIKPEECLSAEDAARVKAAINIIKDFEDSLINHEGFIFI